MGRFLKEGYDIAVGSFLLLRLRRSLPVERWSKGTDGGLDQSKIRNPVCWRKNRTITNETTEPSR
jgi:hypothetical protein